MASPSAPKLRGRLTAAVLTTLLLGAGCAARERPPAAVPAPTREGTASFRVLENEASKKPPLPDDAPAETITSAYASAENRPPEYPAHALRAGCQLGVVPIRLYVGPDGNVVAAARVPGNAVAEDQCHLAFWAATDRAVRAWRFSPAFRLTPRPGRDVDGDGRPDLTDWEQTAITIYLDFEFTFRVVEGAGQVLQRSPAEH